MNTTALVVMAFYTLFILGGIYYYEDKIRDLQACIGDYQRALKLSKSTSNEGHYTYLQLQNKELNEQNNALQVQVKTLKAHIVRLENESKTGNSQYEHSVWKDDIWHGRIVEL